MESNIPFIDLVISNKRKLMYLRSKQSKKVLLWWFEVYSTAKYSPYKDIRGLQSVFLCIKEVMDDSVTQQWIRWSAD